jgi:hypothetical protein
MNAETVVFLEAVCLGKILFATIPWICALVEPDVRF